MRTSFDNENIETLIIIPPDGGWGWMVILSSFLSFFVIDGNGYSFGLYIEILSKEFDIGIGATSVIGSIMCAMMFIIGPIVSALLNKYDFRCITIIGSLFVATGYALCSFTSNHYIFLFSYGFLLGIGYGMMFLPAIVVPNLYFAKKRAIASGLSMCGTGIGSLIAPPAIEKLLELYGWRTTFRILIGAVLIAGLAALAYKPLTPLKAVHKKNQNNVYFRDTTGKETWLQKCSSCWKYSNKYYPTANKIIPSKDAELKDVGSLQTRRQSLYSSFDTTDMVHVRANVGRTYPASSIVSTNFTHQDLCKYNCLICLYSECCENESKPMYRDDIFFSHAIHLIPKYQRPAYMMKKKMRMKEKRRREKLHKSVDQDQEDNTDMMNKYHMEVTHITTNEEYLRAPCCHLHISIIRPLVTIFHLELFKSLAFDILAMSLFFFIIGNMIPFMYIVERSRNYDISPDVSCWFLATIGGSSTIGRLISGSLSTTYPVCTIHIMYLTTFTCGIYVLCSELCMEIWYQFLFAAVFGFTTSFMIVLRPVLIVKLFGLENLTNVAGLQIMIAGIAVSIGPPVAGFLYDFTLTYKYSFYLSGVCFLISSFFLTIIKQVRDWELRKSGQSMDVVSITSVDSSPQQIPMSSSKQTPIQQAPIQQPPIQQPPIQQPPKKQIPNKPVPKNISKK